MNLEEIMEVLYDTKDQIHSRIIEDLVTFNCTPEDAKKFLSAIDIYEKMFLSALSTRITENQFLVENDYDEEQEEDDEIDPLNLN